MPAVATRAARVSVAKTRVHVLVLAAGTSSRMGQPKPLVTLAGTTLLARVLRGLERTSVDGTSVVVGDQASQLRRAISAEDVAVVENPEFARGMSESLRAGLHALPKGTTHALVILADQPFVARSTINALVERARSGVGRIFIPTYHGVRGNPVLFDATLAPDVERIEGDVGCRGMFPSHELDIREVPVEDPGILVDIDTPAELARFEKAAQEREPLGETLRREVAPRLALHAPPSERPRPKRVWHRSNISALANRLRSERAPFALATVVRAVHPTSGRPGYQAVIRPDGSHEGWVGGTCTEEILVSEALAALRDRTPRLVRVSPAGHRVSSEPGIVDRPMVCASGGTVEIYIEPNVPAPNLVVVGDSPIATTLAALGPVLGYRVMLAAPGADTRELPEVAEFFDDLDRLPRSLTPDSFVVVASMGKYDETALRQIARSPVRFIGLVASKKRAASVRADLVREGLSKTEVAAIHSPVGIDVAAETPEEIALSILAEITKVRRTSSAPSHPIVHPAARVAGTETDPVCDMEVERTSPIRADHKGTTYYFCSEACRRDFVKNPAKFAV